MFAVLGNADNKKRFIENQETSYPDFSSWKKEEDPDILLENIKEKSAQLKRVFGKQEKLARLRQELSQLNTEYEYFNQYLNGSNVHTEYIEDKEWISSQDWMALW